ncbi:MAG: AmpG family muropeptide MFS transporter [Proteobacteria bacterium]|nr:AmpG family muropeptide MFS transporter [Pseudomonadota bacterium]
MSNQSQMTRMLNALHSYVKPQILVIFFLGFSAGLPLVLILSTLKALLFDKGIDIRIIGAFAAISLPYSIKFLWAPLVDSLAIPVLSKALGKRRSWIITCQLLLIASIAALGYFGYRGELGMILFFAFATAFISATQDIVIDAYRIENIKQENQAIAAAMYIYGYRIAMLIAGAGALFMSDLMNWDAVYYIMSAMMLIGILTIAVAKEQKSRDIQKAQNFLDWFNHSVIEPLKDFIHRPNWHIIFAFIIFFKLGDAFAGNLTLPFLLDIDFSKTQIAQIVKTFGLIALLCGVFMGGILVKSLGLMKSLWIAAIAQMLSNLSFYYLSFIGNDALSLYFVIFIENFSGGIGDAVFVAYLSNLCNISFTATQYALLASLASFGRSILSSTSGVIVAALGWGNFFLFSTAAALPGIFFLFLLTRKKSINI